MSRIRVVDIGRVGLNVDEASFEDLKIVGKELSGAFKEIGFVFVSNHGIEESIITSARKASKEYFKVFACTDNNTIISLFKLKPEVKGSNEKGSGWNVYQGWVKPGKEVFDQDEKGMIASLELRESYDMNDFSATGCFPDDHVPAFRPCLTTLAESSRSLTFRILKCLSVVLEQDQDFLGDMHKLGDAMKMR
jgi:isopenicillin N synthase-like dioxygenase